MRSYWDTMDAVLRLAAPVIASSTLSSTDLDDLRQFIEGRREAAEGQAESALAQSRARSARINHAIEVESRLLPSHETLEKRVGIVVSRIEHRLKYHGLTRVPSTRRIGEHIAASDSKQQIQATTLSSC